MNQSEKRLFLIQSLLNERPSCQKQIIPADSERQKILLRGLMNVRRPVRIGADFLQAQDAYLQDETAAKGITDIADLTPIQPGLYLWQGDITTLKCDAIVNAANSGMTGCYIPNHRCIDNAIHTFAGVELRLTCEQLMEQQGYPEPTGQAKITPAFNLPCRYVLHTVGPIISGRVTKEDKELLASCYRSCLELAAENDLEASLRRLVDFALPIREAIVDLPSVVFGIFNKRTFLPLFLNGTVTGAFHKILFVDSSRNREEAFAFQFLIQLLDDLVGVGFGNAQFLCYFLHSHKACVFHFITPFIYI